jgi:hypothetical protein
MQADEIIHRPHEDSFKEIEIQDMSDGNNIIYIPRGSLKQDIAVPALNSVQIVAISERDIKFSQVIQFGKFVKWVSMIEFLMIFTYLILGLPFLLFLLILPILGYLSAKKIWKALGVVYLIYLISSVLLRIILIVAFRNLIFIVVGSIVVLFNLICIRYVIKFLKVTKELNDLERAELLILQNGVPLRREEND